MVSASVFLHVGIGSFMGLVTFSLFMLCMVLAFVPPEAVRSQLAQLAAIWRKSAIVEEPIRAGVSEGLAAGRR
jgi:hypothetical protein